jgi:hypothetical protein
MPWGRAGVEVRRAVASRLCTRLIFESVHISSQFHQQQRNNSTKTSLIAASLRPFASTTEHLRATELCHPRRTHKAMTRRLHSRCYVLSRHPVQRSLNPSKMTLLVLCFCHISGSSHYRAWTRKRCGKEQDELPLTGTSSRHSPYAVLAINEG